MTMLLVCALAAFVLLAPADALPTALLQYDAMQPALEDTESRLQPAPIRWLGAVAGPPLVFERNASRGMRPPNASRRVDKRRTPAVTVRPTLRMVAEFEEMDGVLIRFPLGVSLELVAELSLHSRVVRVLRPADDHQLSSIVECSDPSVLLLLLLCCWCVAVLSL